MESSPCANSRFQMGVTVMGFAEHFGQSLTSGFLARVYYGCKCTCVFLKMTVSYEILTLMDRK